MTIDKTILRHLIERLTRLSASDEWDDGLNPTQRVALSYLAKANRFSRAPSQVADYMAATRGTVSQTLKALARKGLIEENRSETDRRWISYSITPAGEQVASRKTAIDDALSNMDEQTAEKLSDGLAALIRHLIAARGQRAFGVCASCRYHRAKGKSGYCTLLEEPLAPFERNQICHEHSEAA